MPTYDSSYDNSPITRVALTDSSGVPTPSGGGTALPTGPTNGQQTVTTSAVALPTVTLTQGVILTARSTNTVSIFIGVSGVTTSTGVELQPGASISAAVSNLNALYVICASSSPVISWLGS